MRTKDLLPRVTNPRGTPTLAAFAVLCAKIHGWREGAVADYAEPPLEKDLFSCPIHVVEVESQALERAADFAASPRVRPLTLDMDRGRAQNLFLPPTPGGLDGR